MLQNYDIIGIDPRGVGMSQPVKCDSRIYNERISSFPTTEEAFLGLSIHNKVLGKSCGELTGPLISYLDTVSVARDLKLVRQAINDREILNFFGRSYGSQIGQTYAELLPENINRMAMDGIIDHTQSETATLNEEAITYEMTMNQFFAWCNVTTVCALYGQDAAAVFDSVVRSAEETPLLAPSCLSIGACRSDVTGEEIRSNVQGLSSSRMKILSSPDGTLFLGLSPKWRKATQPCSPHLSQHPIHSRPSLALQLAVKTGSMKRRA